MDGHWFIARSPRESWTTKPERAEEDWQKARVEKRRRRQGGCISCDLGRTVGAMGRRRVMGPKE